MVCVVPGVPDHDILEQTSVHPQNVVSPGPHRLSLSLHVPRPLVPTSPSPSRHEMLRQIFYYATVLKKHLLDLNSGPQH